jgi:hypothetical protein
MLCQERVLFSSGKGSPVFLASVCQTQEFHLVSLLSCEGGRPLSAPLQAAPDQILPLTSMRCILEETHDKHADADVLRINSCLGDLFACSGRMVASLVVGNSEATAAVFRSSRERICIGERINSCWVLGDRDSRSPLSCRAAVQQECSR